DEDMGVYAKSSYNLSFVGVLPDASTPLVCFVGVNEVPYERNTTEVFKDNDRGNKPLPRSAERLIALSRVAWKKASR
ncbi:MAG: hypothetical protein ACLT98_02945, partial [Eggerthellaceae bacterium]